ncbi:transglutaminase family protein [Botrimarina sp.]|uniref:transglutaminase family protein n=1 Tax=Botrimarina sp. TaxID=2795802 RepID=UPI0032EC9EF9
MLYRIRHTSKYQYSQPVAVCHNLVRLAPRADERQRVVSYRLIVSPEPSDQASREDLFGNRVEYFSIHDAHRGLSLTSMCEVEVAAPPAEPADDPTPWEQVRDRLRRDSAALLDEYRFVFSSTHIPIDQRLRDYAAPAFTPGRPLGEALDALTAQIYKDFEYKSGATTIATTVHESLESRVGVCQDFAHLGIACLRSLGLAARYASGYLRTYPAPGKERLVGADESHAWLSVWSPTAGWLDADPTNNCRPGIDHVTIAIGRDYADICPVQGVVVGGGTPTLSVSVDVAPAERGRG